jgi:predicted amidohydrolase
MTDALRVACITDAFYAEDADERLRARLAEARARGAQLAVLPELPLQAWCPATRTPRPEDAEPPNGPRARRMAQAAREAGLALLGGVIEVDAVTGRRHNTALLFDAEGHRRAAYRKAHLPNEEGFWEALHYEPGDGPPEVAPLGGWTLGIQICSDANRPEGCHILGALGADAILCPRATPPESYDRWRCVLRANAVTSCAYVVSVNRPGGEPGALAGGPSVVFGPDGSAVLETTEPVAVVTLERDALDRARRDYPGSLPVRADLYAKGWARAARRRSRQ